MHAPLRPALPIALLVAATAAAAGSLPSGDSSDYGKWSQIEAAPVAPPTPAFRVSGPAVAAGRHVAGLSSPFGMRIDPFTGQMTHHGGLDLAARLGTPVYASAGGRVVRAAAAGSFGNLVVVDHGGGLQTYYGHLSRILVSPGELVASGAPLGAVGSTGRSTGPHLHFEVRIAGRSVDPRPLMRTAVADAPPGKARRRRS